MGVAVFGEHAVAAELHRDGGVDAVPTPASTMTGTFACSGMIDRLCGLRIPRPEPMGAAERHDGGAADVLELPARRSDRRCSTEGRRSPLLHERRLGRLERLLVVGVSVFRIADSGFTIDAMPSSRAGGAYGPPRRRCSSPRCSGGGVQLFLCKSDMSEPPGAIVQVDAAGDGRSRRPRRRWRARSRRRPCTCRCRR